MMVGLGTHVWDPKKGRISRANCSLRVRELVNCTSILCFVEIRAEGAWKSRDRQTLKGTKEQPASVWRTWREAGHSVPCGPSMLDWTALAAFTRPVCALRNVNGGAGLLVSHVHMTSSGNHTRKQFTSFESSLKKAPMRFAVELKSLHTKTNKNRMETQIINASSWISRVCLRWNSVMVNESLLICYEFWYLLSAGSLCF